MGRLDPAGAGEALTVQYAAYLSEARRYATTEIPPLVETVAGLAVDLARPDVLAFGAWIGPRLVGSVRMRGGDATGDPGVWEFARFSVAPDVQGHGVGTALFDRAHAALPPSARSSWLVTGDRSDDTRRLYLRGGYRDVSRLVDVAGVALIRMERPARVHAERRRLH